jgi:hypothetical protein
MVTALRRIDKNNASPAEPEMLDTRKVALTFYNNAPNRCGEITNKQFLKRRRPCTKIAYTTVRCAVAQRNQTPLGKYRHAAIGP